MNVLVVGSSKATEKQAESTIRHHLINLGDMCVKNNFIDPTIVNSNCKGVDQIANKIARDLKLKVKTITSKSLGLKNEKPYDWVKNNEIANNESAKICVFAYSFVLPLGTNKNKGRCTWCKRAGLDHNHEKSSGCRTALQVPKHKIIVLGLWHNNMDECEEEIER